MKMCMFSENPWWLITENIKIGESVVHHGYRAHDNIICLFKRELS